VVVVVVVVGLAVVVVGLEVVVVGEYELLPTHLSAVHLVVVALVVVQATVGDGRIHALATQACVGGARVVVVAGVGRGRTRWLLSWWSAWPSWLLGK
jgi:hypothetical protein